jgi:glycosyltransferase involved in cell wall biosynthesis
MSEIEISVIVPTYDRKNVLTRCLRALFDQNFPREKYEIIVIDDGSTDGTEDLVRKMATPSPCALRFFKQRKKRPTAARNVGLEMRREN